MSDNAALQKLIDAGDKIPAKEYSIDITQAIKVKGPVNFTGCTLRAIPTNSNKGAILEVRETDGVVIRGGTFYGERVKHIGTAPYGNGAHGVKVAKGATNVVLEDFLVADCTGDGVYIDGAENVTVRKIKSHRNRRQGLSLIAGKNIKIENSTFSDTSGTEPGDGIDIEPDKGDVIEGVSIGGCTFGNNAGAHIEIASKRGKVSKVIIRGNKFDGKTVPLKIQGQEPSLFARLKALWGDYSGYAREVKIA